MKKHLPSLGESLELSALALMVAGLQWAIGSWSWTSFFALGFIWNWAVLNGWVNSQVDEKKYRFSVLKGITRFHQALMGPIEDYPRLKELAQVAPAGLAIGLMALLLASHVPWWATFFGSLAFILVRRQLRDLG